jgi:hypothetical protein
MSWIGTEITTSIRFAAGLTANACFATRAIAAVAFYTHPSADNFVATTFTPAINALPSASAAIPAFAAVVVGLEVPAAIWRATFLLGSAHLGCRSGAAVPFEARSTTNDPTFPTRAIAVDACFGVVTLIAALTTILRVSLLVCAFLVAFVRSSAAALLPLIPFSLFLRV